MSTRPATGGGPHTLRRELLTPLRGRGTVLRRLFGWSLVEALPALLTGRLVAGAVDAGFAVGRPWTGLGWLAVMGAAIAIGSWGTRQVNPLLADIVEPYRDALVSRVVSAALLRAVEGGTPDGTSAVSRLTQQVEMVRESYAGLLMVARRFVFTVGGAVVGMLLLSPWVLALVLPPLLAALALFALLAGRMADRQHTLILADERVAEATATLVPGVRDAVACGAERTARRQPERSIEAQSAAARRLAALAPVRTVAIALGGWLPVVLLMAAAPRLTDHGTSPGVVVGAITYVLHSLQPALRSLVQGLGVSGLRLVVALRRILAMTPPGTGTAPPSGEAGIRPDTGITGGGYELALRSVYFGYGVADAGAKPLLRALDLVIEEDDHVAMVGPSGIGKSTLAGLMTGMLTPWKGEVSLGGVPLGRLPAQRLAGQRVLIPQEAYVFSGTLEENLTYLGADVGTAEIERAVIAFGMEPWVERLGGYRAGITASGLSAGERQQIALVRAYLSPAPLVVLDEATCHLDPVAEARAEDAFARRPGSLVVIAHRLSSALRARRVILLDGSDVLQGSHAELLRLSPLYRDLVGRWEDPAAPAAPAGPEGPEALTASRPPSRS
ncbi:ABC transporter ATP-binding protein [Streptomyces sp. HD1123-B1]|uniref:ATP-binding cassette domain-containing protein n=1 Tax=Streptomyces huangiella TaxID=3228804 RepID=UPI003D7E7278